MPSKLIEFCLPRPGPEMLAKLHQAVPETLLDFFRRWRFRQTVRWAATHCRFYRDAFRRRGIDPAQVRTPTDLGDFYTTPEDLATDPASFLSGEPAIVFESSGTSGRNKQVYYSWRELEQMGRMMAAGLYTMGVNRGDRVANAFDFSMWIPGLLTHNALMAAGVFSMAFGKVDPTEVYRRLRSYRFNVVMGEPTWLIRLTELAEQHGAVPLKMLIGGAEEMPRDAFAWMARVWPGVAVRMCYGSVELGGTLGYQPCAANDGYHVDDLDFYPEIVEPDAEGYGELVYTTLTRRLMPLIRYRSRDVSRWLPGRCACGLAGRRMSRLRGRRDEMVVASGGNLYPLMFENILGRVAGLTHDWQVVFRLEALREIMEIHVECPPREMSPLYQEIAAQASEQYPDLMKNLALGIFQMRLQIHAPGTLRCGRKLQRLLDLRHSATVDGT